MVCVMMVVDDRLCFCARRSWWSLCSSCVELSFPLVVRSSPFVMLCSPFVMLGSPFVVRCSPLVVRWISFVVCWDLLSCF